MYMWKFFLPLLLLKTVVLCSEFFEQMRLSSLIATTQLDITAPTVTPAATIPGSNNWCVARDNVAEMELQAALDYACGIGEADCTAIQSNGRCYSPSTLKHHASYAFNSYYQRNPVPSSCSFGGTAVVITTDPSSRTCPYPSTSTSSTVLNVTNLNSSTIFGVRPLSPAAPSSRAARERNYSLVCLSIIISAVVARHQDLLPYADMP